MRTRLIQEGYRRGLLEAYRIIEDMLNEGKSILFPKFGQLVFVVGGAGSGKTTIINKVLRVDGKVFDVDDIKLSIQKAAKKGVGTFLTDKERESVSKGEFTDEKFTRTMHELADQKFGKHFNEETQTYNRVTPHAALEGIYKTAMQSKDKRHLPNIIFSITGKKMEDIEQYTTPFFEAGYTSENVHIVWVLTSEQYALKDDENRDRTVGEDILLATHRGVRDTMRNLIKYSDNYRDMVDGDIYVVFNDYKANEVDYGRNTSKQQSKIAGSKGEYVDYVGKIQIKEKGKSAKSMQQLKQESVNRVRNIKDKGKQKIGKFGKNERGFYKKLSNYADMR